MEQTRTSQPAIAGILMLVSAGFKLLAFLGLSVSSFFYVVPDSFPKMSVMLLVFVFLPFIAIIVLTVVGGISSLQRKRWGLALTGAIVAMLPFSLLGIAATVLVAISKDEFGKA